MTGVKQNQFIDLSMDARCFSGNSNEQRWNNSIQLAQSSDPVLKYHFYSMCVYFWFVLCGGGCSSLWNTSVPCDKSSPRISEIFNARHPLAERTLMSSKDPRCRKFWVTNLYLPKESVGNSIVGLLFGIQKE